MSNVIYIGTDIIDKEYYIADLIFKKYNLEIILKHLNKKNAVVDFGLNAIDYRFSRELFRINDLIFGDKFKYWPILRIDDSKYLKKLNDESSGVMLVVDEKLKHYIIYDDDFVIDVISSEDPTVFIDEK